MARIHSNVSNFVSTDGKSDDEVQNRSLEWERETRTGWFKDAIFRFQGSISRKRWKIALGHN